MRMVEILLSVALLGLGLLGLMAAVQWRQGRWLEERDRIAASTSVHLIAGVPAGSVLVLFLGLMVVWPGFVVPAMLDALVFVGVMSGSAASQATAEQPRQQSRTGVHRAPNSLQRRQVEDRADQRRAG
jgi:hypothetical protein